MRAPLISFLICLMIVSGCNFRADGKTNKDRERECEEQCAKMISMPFLPFDFMYYDSAEVDSVIVKEISADKKDTLIHVVTASYWETHRGTPRQKVWIPSWKLEKEIPLQNEYLIIVKGEAPHVLRNFKMGAKPLCNMFDCDYEPTLKQFELDGEFDEDNHDGIIIRKK